MRRQFHRLLCGAIVLMLLLPLAVLSASAIREDNASYQLLVTDCDTAWDGRFELDTADKTQGTASCSITINPHTGENLTVSGSQTLLVLQKVFETPLNVTQANAFSFDYYISDVTLLDQI